MDTVDVAFQKMMPDYGYTTTKVGAIYRTEIFNKLTPASIVATGEDKLKTQSFNAAVGRLWQAAVSVIESEPVELSDDFDNTDFNS